MIKPALIDTAEKFHSRFGVSRETLDRLCVYESLLKRWQRGTNLVAPATLDRVWHRHFADSAQLLELAPDSKIWLDLGSGAGFPGLVIAICAANREGMRVHVVESNARKCAFVHEVVRETGCSVEIHEARIESVHAQARVIAAEIVTARALAPLTELLKLSAPFFGPGTTGLFLKGRQAEHEMVEAEKNWRYETGTHPSITDARARIVRINALRRKGSEDVEAAHG